MKRLIRRRRETAKEKTRRQHKPSATQSEIDEKIRRKCAVEEAAKRKAMLKYVIEKVAKESGSAEAFVAALAAEEISLCRDEKKGLCAENDRLRRKGPQIFPCQRPRHRHEPYS